YPPARCPCTEVGRRGEPPLGLLAEDFHYRVSPQVNDHEIGGARYEGSATARPDCRPRQSPICDHRSSYHLPWRLAAWCLPVPRVTTLSPGRTSPGSRSGNRSTRLYQGAKSILASSSSSPRSPRTK